MALWYRLPASQMLAEPAELHGAPLPLFEVTMCVCVLSFLRELLLVLLFSWMMNMGVFICTEVNHYYLYTFRMCLSKRKLTQST